MRTFCFSTALCSLLFACGTVEQADLGGDDPGGKGDKGDESSPDAGVEPTYEGRVALITHTNAQASNPQTFVQASFGQGALGLGPVLAEAGGCSLTAFADPQAAMPAGDLEVTGGSQPITMPFFLGAYNFMAEQAVFSVGSTLTVSAPGDVVPAFTANVDVPPRLGAVPIPSSISRSAGTTLTWTPGGASTAFISIVFKSSGDLRLLRCLTTDSGSFEISAQALALVPANVQSAQIAVAHYNEVIVKPNPSWSIAIQAGDLDVPAPTIISIVP
ncbi:MAG: hypothetical protein AB7P03_17370 [Kofleriaceae bacterium]